MAEFQSSTIEEQSLFISPETIRAATTNLWDVPDNAQIRGEAGSPGYQANWYDVVQIRDCTVRSLKDLGTDVLTVEVEVPPDSEVGINVGRRHWEKFWITMSAARDKSHKDFEGTNRAIKNLTHFLKACGVDTKQGYDPKGLFAGGTLQGMRLRCRVSCYCGTNGNEGMRLDRWIGED